jgi:hypothetical protein
MRLTTIRLVLALAAAAVIAAVQAWGWRDAAQTLADGASWQWRASWPIVRVVALRRAAGRGGALWGAVLWRAPRGSMVDRGHILAR